MLDNIERFDMKKALQRQKLRWLMKILTAPKVRAQGQIIHKINMEGIKPPYILMGNHNSYYDMMVLEKAILPNRCNYVVAIDGFIKREKLLRSIGGICKRKFTNDINLLRHIKTVLNNGDIMVIYPEARYSLCGTKSIVPKSNAALAKMFKVPLVTLTTHGDHIVEPFYNVKRRKIKGLEATLQCIATKEEVETLSVDELNDRLQKALEYDDWKWLRESNILLKDKDRAKGLHKVLYQCPHCLTEYEMTSSGSQIKCNHCGKTYEMDEKGVLHALNGETEFPYVPDWYEWERSNVRKEVEAGTYKFKCPVRVDALPNSKGYIDLGMGELIHDMNGFKLTGKYQDEEYEVVLLAKDHYSVHIEYEYLGKFGDCVDLNTLNDTFYVYPKCEKFSVTKMSLACEELFKFYNPDKKQTCKCTLMKQKWCAK